MLQIKTISNFDTGEAPKCANNLPIHGTHLKVLQPNISFILALMLAIIYILQQQIDF